MTFYEAALSVLEREGKPLHVKQITELVLKDNLLSHVGKSPEEVMQSRLLAMAKRRNDRKVVATAPQTYGLLEWGIPEDPAALEPAPEVDREKLEGPPLRGRERHPTANPNKVRIAGRGERGRYREEEEERKRRRKLPPLSEVAVEVLTAVGKPLSAVELAAAARERELVSEDLGAEALLNALREDNRRRGDSGRRQLFELLPSGEIGLKPAPVEAAELEAAVAFAAGAPARREERGPGASKLIAQALEQRRQVLRTVRRKLGELDASGLEKAVQLLLDLHGYQELKVARRSREGPLFMARRREGLTDIRYVIRLIRGNGEIGKNEVEELRRSVGQHQAHIGILVSPGDASREARQDAAASQPLVFLTCGEALAEALVEKKLGVTATTIEVLVVDEELFRRCRERGREERDKRREARGERPHREGEQRPAVGGNGHEGGIHAPAAAVSDEERARNAAALAQQMIGGPDAVALKRREEEARIRAAAHEKIEVAELQARAGKSSSSGSAA
jgi:hypothetical protein